MNQNSNAVTGVLNHIPSGKMILDHRDPLAHLAELVDALVLGSD